MKFKLQGNIEKANYFLIYKEFEGHPFFFFLMGRGQTFSTVKKIVIIGLI